ncbi:hypothetical protein B5807_07959 [Epicoccum nigrum]|uniref:Uncharacterized protein n=1 Tax=Epicoccum nigrum TaxID=105696 RepID=A0A1Y2LX66_EPING|nr:hypothetical protein B5807_07959 [Epicoccum nigrum]
MTGYVDASSQTEWAGLMQKNIVRPDALYPNTDTPPDEPLTNKEQCVASLRTKSPAEQQGQPHTPPRSKEPSQDELPTMATSPLLARRQNRPDFVPHIDLPPPEQQSRYYRAFDTDPLNDEVPASPPPSGLILSPLPEANKRFAGHTPLYAGSPKLERPKRQPQGRNLRPIVPEKIASLPIHELIVEQDPIEDADTEPLPESESQSATPQQDIGLTGPLTLAPNPGDGSQDKILLSALDSELSKIARQQARDNSSNSASSELPLSRQESTESRTSEPRPVDGVIFKKTVPWNFGAPFGEV